MSASFIEIWKEALILKLLISVGRKGNICIVIGIKLIPVLLGGIISELAGNWMDRWPNLPSIFFTSQLGNSCQGSWSAARNSRRKFVGSPGKRGVIARACFVEGLLERMARLLSVYRSEHSSSLWCCASIQFQRAYSAHVRGVNSLRLNWTSRRGQTEPLVAATWMNGLLCVYWRTGYLNYADRALIAN